MRTIFNKRIGCIVLLALAAIGLHACSGDSSSSSSSDPGTPTTLVTSLNGQSTVNCAQNQQCIDPFFAKIIGLATTLSQAATPWTNTTTNIITISQIPYVDGSNNATAYAAAGSVFTMTTDVVAGTRSFKGNGLPTTLMGTYPVQSGTAAYSYYAAELLSI